ncbi:MULTISPECIES: hypothetical protein [Streptacidiphilus]|uniref:OB-fold domain-containing protein n=1 Tax=Streptacidiphilus cavernicola TaxID=3342716 RepID=A0ABV6UL54_9ACTN|nr:hypothetical protein [Streptacidiphilus jeojiense]
MTELKGPMAVAEIRWLPESQGGRSSGPPTAPVYAATATFPGSDAPLLSILVEHIDPQPHGLALANIGFLAPELARPHLHVGAELLITEGPRIVAHAIIRHSLASA